MTERQQQAREMLLDWARRGYPPLPVHSSPGQAIHNWHHGWLREIVGTLPLPPGDSTLSVRLYALFEADARDGMAAGPGWLGHTNYGFRPSWWSIAVNEWACTALPNYREGYPTPSGYSIPGAVSPGASWPPWWNLAEPAPTFEQWTTTCRERLHPDDWGYLVRRLGLTEPGEPEGPDEPEPTPPDPPSPPPPPEEPLPSDLRERLREQLDTAEATVELLDDALVAVRTMRDRLRSILGDLGEELPFKPTEER